MTEKIFYRFHEFSTGDVIVLAFLFAALVWFLFYSLRDRSRYIYMFPRLVFLLLLILILINPEKIKHKIIPYSPHLYILVDRSLSMKYPGINGVSKMDSLKEFWKKNSGEIINSLPPGTKITYAGFSDKIKPNTPGKLFTIDEKGFNTNIISSIQRASESLEKNRDLIGVVVLTDAEEIHKDNINTDGDNLPPVSVIQVQSDRRLSDVGITRVEHSGIMYLGETNSVTVTVEGKNFKGKKVPVYLYQGNKLLERKKIFFKDNMEVQQLEFDIRAKNLGKQTYKIEIPVNKNEYVKENNRRYFILETVRNKIRIMLVAGRPTWEYRFLRRTLKKDPSVELVAFTILRSPTDLRVEPQNELALIPFPIRQIFAQHLNDFQILIFNNFDYREFRDFSPRYLENIRQFVSNGGAFLAAGTVGMLDSRWVNTPLADLMPVVLSPGVARVEKSFLMLPVEKNINHPVMRIASNKKESWKIWNDMPELLTFLRLSNVKKDAMVLGQFQGYPIISVYSYGKGRTMLVNTDTTWHWKFLENSHPDVYDEFWHNAVRWLIKSPEYLPVIRMDNEKKFYAGDPLNMGFQILNENFKPDKNPRISLSLLSPGGNRKTLPVTVLSPEEGIINISFSPEKTGKYTYELKNLKRKGNKTIFSEDVIVQRRSLEQTSIFADTGQLNRIVRKSGGRWMNIHQDQPVNIPVRVKKPEVKITERKALLHNPLILAILVSLLSAEWMLRRHRGDM